MPTRAIPPRSRRARRSTRSSARPATSRTAPAVGPSLVGDSPKRARTGTDRGRFEIIYAGGAAPCRPSASASTRTRSCRSWPTSRSCATRRTTRTMHTTETATRSKERGAGLGRGPCLFLPATAASQMLGCWLALAALAMALCQTGQAQEAPARRLRPFRPAAERRSFRMSASSTAGAPPVGSLARPGEGQHHRAISPAADHRRRERRRPRHRGGRAGADAGPHRRALACASWRRRPAGPADGRPSLPPSAGGATGRGDLDARLHDGARHGRPVFGLKRAIDEGVMRRAAHLSFRAPSSRRPRATATSASRSSCRGHRAGR